MGTHYKGKKEEKIALDTWIKLARANNTVFNLIKPSMTKFGLTTSQFAVLETIFYIGPLPQNKIGKKLLVTSGNIVKVIDNLEKSGLVERTPDENDRRKHIIKLTTEGKKIIEITFDQHVASVLNAFKSLNKNEQEQLGKLCKRLGTNK